MSVFVVSGLLVRMMLPEGVKLSSRDRVATGSQPCYHRSVHRAGV